MARAVEPVPQKFVSLSADKEDCPRGASRLLNPATLRCLCGADFTAEGLVHWRALPVTQALRTA